MSSRAAKATSRATRSRPAEPGAGTHEDATSRLPGPSKQKPAKPSGKVRASLSVDVVPVTEFPVPRIERQLESLNSASEDLQKQLGVHDARLSAVEDDVRELREQIAQFVAALFNPRFQVETGQPRKTGSGVERIKVIRGSPTVGRGFPRYGYLSRARCTNIAGSCGKMLRHRSMVKLFALCSGVNPCMMMHGCTVDLSTCTR